jgi:methylglutaconyl-CoA hydratase
MEPLIKIQVIDSVAFLTLNRIKKHNAISPDLIHLLLENLNHISALESVHTVAFSGNGSSFCSGADLNWISNASDEEKKLFSIMLEKISSLDKIFITQVHGSCLGGAMGFLLVSDYVLAHENTKFQFPELRHGIFPKIILPHMIHSLGAHKSRRLLLMAESFDAHKATQYNLIDEIFSDTTKSKTLQRILESSALLDKKTMIATKKHIVSQLYI